MDDGRMLGGRYRLDERLGDGGMSVVWRAYDVVLGRSVAVKILAADLAASPVFRQTIRTEARAAASLSHPNVTAVFDYGETVDEAGELVPYVVMELLSGQSLAERLAEGPLDPPTALRVCAEVASALAAAHAHGLVHRDIKPGNVMLTPAGAKVFDFGLAAPVGQRDDSDPDGPILGTAAYLAPERLAGAAVTAASDVYALALLLFRATTARLPWPVHTVTEMIAAHVYAEPDPLPELDGVPSEVRDLARRCLAKAPTDRPTAHEAALVLAAAGRTPTDTALVVRAPAGAAVIVGASADATTATTIDPTVHSRRSVRVLSVAGVTVLALAAPFVVSVLANDPGAGSAGQMPTGTVALTDAGGPTGPTGPTGPATPPATSPMPYASPTSAPPAGTGGGEAAHQGSLLTGPPSPPGTPPETPPPTPTTGPPQTFASPGGSVTAACGAAGAYLVSWTPEPGFETRNIEPGPAEVAKIVFRSDTTRVRVRIACKDGVPTAKIDTAEIT